MLLAICLRNTSFSNVVQVKMSSGFKGCKMSQNREIITFRWFKDCIRVRHKGRFTMQRKIERENMAKKKRIGERGRGRVKTRVNVQERLNAQCSLCLIVACICICDVYVYVMGTCVCVGYVVGTCICVVHVMGIRIYSAGIVWPDSCFILSPSNYIFSVIDLNTMVCYIWLLSILPWVWNFAQRFCDDVMLHIIDTGYPWDLKTMIDCTILYGHCHVTLLNYYTKQSQLASHDVCGFEYTQNMTTSISNRPYLIPDLSKCPFL